LNNAQNFRRKNVEARHKNVENFWKFATLYGQIQSKAKNHETKIATRVCTPKILFRRFLVLNFFLFLQLFEKKISPGKEYFSSIPNFIRFYQILSDFIRFENLLHNSSSLEKKFFYAFNFLKSDKI